MVLVDSSSKFWAIAGSDGGACSIGQVHKLDQCRIYSPGEAPIAVPCVSWPLKSTACEFFFTPIIDALCFSVHFLLFCPLPCLHGTPWV